MIRLLLILAALLTPLAALAQDAEEARDRSFLTGVLEDALSYEGTEVRIDGFEGALSSQATADAITISDAEGVWLRLEDVTLDWNRSALLRGRVEVQELTAGLIALERPPLPQQGMDLPEPEARAFSLPELPVSVDIDRIAADRIEIGEPVLGEAFALSATASAQLADGSAALDIVAQRLGGPGGIFDADVSFSNETGMLDVAVTLDEAPGGIVARTLDLPGLPSVRLSVQGEGPLDDFAADVTLATDGTERLDGAVRLSGADAGRAFAVDLNGDLSTLIAPQFREFFGDQVALTAEGTALDDGGLRLDQLNVETAALQLGGAAEIGPDGWPVRLDLDGTLAAGAGPVTLPAPGAPRLSEARLSVSYDAAESERWQLALNAEALETGQVEAESVALTGEGTLSRSGGGVRALDGVLRLAGAGLDFDDPALARAVGEALALRLQLEWQEGEPVRLTGIDAEGAGLSLTGDAVIEGSDTGPIIASDLTVETDDLGRFSGLAGTELSGEGRIRLDGSFTPLTGAFDATLDGQTTDLGIGQAQADALLAGQTQLSLRASRDLGGTFVDELRIENDQITATGEAEIRSGASEVTLDARLADAALLAEQLSGPISVAGTVARTAEEAPWTGTLEIDGPLQAQTRVSGTLTGPEAEIDLAAELPQIGALVPQLDGPARVDGTVRRTGEQWEGELSVTAPEGITAEIAGQLTGPGAEIAIDAEVPQLGVLVPQIDGPGTVTGTVRRAGEEWVGELAIAGPGGLDADIAGQLTGPGAVIDIDAELEQLGEYVPQLEGPATARGTVRRAGDQWQGDLTVTAEAGGLTADLSGTLTGPGAAIGIDARLDRLEEVVPQLGGAATVNGTVRRAGEDWAGDLTVTGPAGLTAEVSGTLTGPGAAVEVDARIARLGDLVPQLSGAATVSGTVRRAGEEWVGDLAVTGPGGLTGEVSGTLTEPDIELTAQIADLGALVPALQGAATADARLFRQDDGDLAATLEASGPYGATLEAEVRSLTGDLSASFDLSVPQAGRLAPELSGSLSARGTVQRQPGGGYAVDARLNGPGTAAAEVSGSIAAGGTLALDIDGTVPLGLAGPFLGPNSLSGTARFDLAVNGPPALSSVTGQISTSGARLSLPQIENAVTGIDGQVTLEGGRAQVRLTGALATGGRLSVTGPIGLTSPFPADLDLRLADARLVDPGLYTVQLGADLQLTGPLTGQPRLSGIVRVDRAEITVPDSGLTALGELPDITHVNTPAEVARTLRRADLTLSGQPIDPEPDGDGAGGLALDITVSAPARIFVRGRGLDAELGGEVSIRGTTQDVVTIGRFDLIRGRLDVLEQRFNLDEGSITLQGDFDPYLRFVAETEADTIDARIILEGRASEPDVRFESTPELPQEEILAQVFFGRDLTELSPLQAVQLANSVAVLAGRGGTGLLERVRGTLGLDDLDITTDEEGNTAARAGAYISDNVYTGVTVDSEGESSISLNLDVSPSLTVRGKAGTKGDTSVGIFFERDY